MRIFVILVLSVLVFACSKRQESTTTTEQSMQTDSTTATTVVTVVDRDWTLVEVNGQPVTLTKGPTLRLTVDGTRATGFAGCNQFTGMYVLSGDSLSFQPLVMTKMACPEGMDVEMTFANALQGTRTYRITKDSLELWGDTGVVARFKIK